MSKVVSPEQAAALIPDGATVGASAMLVTGWPEEIARAMEARFLVSGHPRGLTLVHASGTGDWKTRGAERFAHPGMIDRWVGGHCSASPDLARMIMEGGCEGYCLPQGVIAQLWREIAAHRPGLITKTGLSTFVDPRIEGGRLNDRTLEDLIEVVSFANDEWLFYPSFEVDVAIIRGTIADEKGNLTVGGEGQMLECLPLAQAVRNCGGIVIAEAEYLAQAGSLDPRTVRVPGALVDHVVISAPGDHWQSPSTAFNPSFSGDIRTPLGDVPRMQLDERLVIARRAAMALKPGCTVNLGIGVPQGIGNVLAAEGLADVATVTTEGGVFGGVPATGKDFGMSFNPEAFVEQQAQFDWYGGGGLDLAFLGAAQIDAHGNVNVSKFSGRFVGAGGFIDITQHSKALVFCGTFTAGGLSVAIEDGRLSIVREGRFDKYIEQVEQITFSGEFATKTGQPVLFVSERAVFELIDGKLTLVETAPGIDVERDILAHMGFAPAISPALTTMPEGLFRPEWGGLGAALVTPGEGDR